MSNDLFIKLRADAASGLTRLDLSHRGLTEFPREIFEFADSLEILDLTGNGLSQLPNDLPRLQKLKVIFCSSNHFTELPTVLGRCEGLEMVGFKANRIAQVDPDALPPLLRWLILTDNCIESLPDALGRRPRLQKLMLAGNRLTSLPETLADCTQLELLRIAANRLETLPAWLSQLPRLAWLAFSGNPLCRAAPVPDTGSTVAWADIRLGPVLGEGASGVIHRAEHRDGAAVRTVAVKVFKGAITSDGLPESELAACLAAASHPALVGSIARLEGHPEGRPALLMPLIGPDWRVLAGPPSLQSCTRDVYADDSRFSLAACLRTALDIASAAAHLHRHGMLHGDLYAHNIMVRETGQAMLGDFGAASFLGALPPFAVAELQKLEVRAFGCLLEELLAHSTGEPPNAWMPALARLHGDCLHPDKARRPLFDEIESRLRSIQAH